MVIVNILGSDNTIVNSKEFNTDFETIVDILAWWKANARENDRIQISAPLDWPWWEVFAHDN